MRFRISGAVVRRDLNFSRVRDLRLSDVSSEEILSSLLEKHFDFGCGTGSMVNLGFHRFYFRSRLRNVITEITDFIEILASSFSSLSAFVASDSSIFHASFFVQPRKRFLLPHSWAFRTKNLAGSCGS